MVRIKYRYLLVHILYPDPAESESRSTTKVSDKSIPDLVQFHRPSPRDLQPQHLVRSIKDQVLHLYGDYGLGLISASLNGPTRRSLYSESLANAVNSQVPLNRNLNSHRSMFTHTFSNRLVSSGFHDPAATHFQARFSATLRDAGCTSIWYYQEG